MERQLQEMKLCAAATVRLTRAGWFEVKSVRIPNRKGMPLGRCQGMTAQGNIPEQLSWTDRTCTRYDSALAWLCLQEAVQRGPNKSAVYWTWEFCKQFVTECNNINRNDTTITQMAGIDIRVRVRRELVGMTILELWRELDDTWRTQVS